MSAPSSSKKSIIDHTTTCSVCGHRVLHKTLEEHMKRQHPGEYQEDRFAQSLTRTATVEWWDRAIAQDSQAVSLGQVVEYINPDDVKKSSRRSSKGNLIHCPVCHTTIKNAQMMNHMLNYHQVRYDLVTGKVEPLRPGGEILNVRPAPPAQPATTNSRQPIPCEVCGINIPPIDMERHLAKHTYNKPPRQPDEIHCPVCTLNIRISRLPIHLANKHSDLPSHEQKRLTRLAEDKFRGFVDDEGKPLVPPGVASKLGWVRCEWCSNPVAAQRYENHKQMHLERKKQS
jgi:hypothetical protein